MRTTARPSVTTLMVGAVPGLDPFDVGRVRRAPGILRDFNDAGVLAAADVHVARRLGDLLDDGDEAVLLGAALAVRAPRLGHVLSLIHI